MIMQPTSHFNRSHTTSAQDALDPGMPTTSMYESSNSMQYNVQDVGNYFPTSSGTTTPVSSVSTRSSISYQSNVSSTSTSSRPKRSSMKSVTPAVGVIPNRKSSPPTVRFADPEPLSRPKPTPVQQQHQSHLDRNGIPNPMLRYRHRPASSAYSSASSRYFAGPQAYPTLPPRGVPTPQSRQIQYRKARVGQRFSAPVSRPDPRWSGIPLPANFTPPSLTLEQRVTSFQSVASNISVQSAPAALQAPSAASPPGQYNPLENYIPCLNAACTVHYSPTHGGPTYYLPEGPYSLPKHRGYCQRHTSTELREANAQCKREWESLRQNAGRKTLGQIATEFDSFLENFRQDRRSEDADLQRRQRRIVLGAARKPVAGQNQSKQDDDTDWKWAYTPRQCTRSSCPSTPYSPFANQLYTFYTTPRPSTFFPLRTLCPSCAKNEVEAFEHYIQQKWTSRCGWDDTQWNEWFENTVKDRNMEREFWERAQERVVKEKGPARWVEKAMEEQEEEEEDKRVEKKEKDRKKSVFRRLFGA